METGAMPGRASEQGSDWRSDSHRDRRDGDRRRSWRSRSRSPTRPAFGSGSANSIPVSDRSSRYPRLPSNRLDPTPTQPPASVVEPAQELLEPPLPTIPSPAPPSVVGHKIAKLPSAELYERLDCVGEGTYGKVYKARNTENGVFVALKRIRMEGEKDGFPVTAMREIKLLQSLRHRNVVCLHEMMVSKGQSLRLFGSSLSDAAL
jgi:hypothetical protein